MNIKAVLNEGEVALRAKHYKLIQTGLANNPPSIPADRVDALTPTVIAIINRDDLCFNGTHRLDALEEILVRDEGKIFSHLPLGYVGLGFGLSTGSCSAWLSSYSGGH